MLTKTTFRRSVTLLAATDPDLRAIVHAHGVPAFWAREPGFATLLLLILEQQVSLASARAAFDRLERRLGGVEPARLLETSDEALRADGFSRQKARYARALAAAVADGSLDLDALATLPDAEARARLVALPGVGPWTADVYLLSALRRPDVWPSGDLALQEAARVVKRLHERPSGAALDALAEPWRPHRATAARLLWHAYLSARKDS